MATEAPLYDLTLLLDTQMEAERRDQILANVEHAIDGTGEIVGRHEWGTRTTAYEVLKHTDAEYHLIQFRGPRELLEQLDHNLKITDGILRHRIIRLRPGTPPPPDLAHSSQLRVRRAKNLAQSAVPTRYRPDPPLDSANQRASSIIRRRKEP